jgi:branched-chain amino acid transport system substrate-binding protein
METRIKKTFALVVVLALILISVILMFFINNKTGLAIADNSQPLKIGVFTVLSGDAALYGQNVKQGLDLAAEDINKKGGINGRPVELVYQDTHLDSKEAVSVMNKFVYVDKYPIVIAAEGSGAVSAAVPLSDQTKTLTMITLASTPTLKDAGDYVFRVVPSDSYQGTEMARLAKELGYKKAGILYVSDSYGQGVRDVFDKQFNVVSEESFDASASDFRTQLTKIKSTNPDILIIVARVEYPQILKQVKEMGLSQQIMTSVEFKDDKLIEASGEASEGVLIPFYKEATDFVNYKTEFKQKYGKDAGTFSDYGYDSLMVIAKAAEKANSVDSTKLKDELYKMTYYGATGVVKFDSNGEVTGKAFDLYQVKNGKIAKY